MDFIWYMLFSGVEGVTIYSVIFYIYRFNAKKYLPHIIIMVSLVNVSNYLLTDDLNFLSPLIGIVCTYFFYITIVRIPAIYAIPMVITGYLSYALLQALIVVLSFGFFDLNGLTGAKGYLLQATTSIISFTVVYMFYRRGYGFGYDFEKLRFSWEKIFIVSIISVFTVGLGFVMYFQEIYVAFFSFLIAMIIFLGYSLRKDAKSNNASLSGD